MYIEIVLDDAEQQIYDAYKGYPRIIKDKMNDVKEAREECARMVKENIELKAREACDEAESEMGKDILLQNAWDQEQLEARVKELEAERAQHEKELRVLADMFASLAKNSIENDQYETYCSSKCKACPNTDDCSQSTINDKCIGYLITYARDKAKEES